MSAAELLGKQVTPGTVIRWNEVMARRTTLRVGGPADIYVEPVSEADLTAVLVFCAENKLPFFVLGRGSNLLVRATGFRGGGVGCGVVGKNRRCHGRRDVWGSYLGSFDGFFGHCSSARARGAGGQIS